jgi:hypothetical protein
MSAGAETHGFESSMRAMRAVSIGIVCAIVVVGFLGWRARRNSGSTPHRSLVDDYRIVENSWYVLGYLAIIVVIGVSLLYPLPIVGVGLC